MFSRLLNQTVTHWIRTGQDRYNKPTFSAPTELTGRWEGGKGLDRSATMEEKINSARVYLSSAVAPGDYLYLGASSEDSPLDVTDAAEVKGCASTPSVSGNKVLYTAIVMRGRINVG